MPTHTKNRKAYHDYEILETLEAGIKLTGAEVKSVKNNRIQVSQAFAKIKDDQEIFLHNAYIAPYKEISKKKYNPRRSRKLLLHKQQIHSLHQATQGSNLTIIPLKVYTNRRGLVKVRLGLAKGKKKFEKRKKIREREVKREIERTLKRADLQDYGDV